MLQNQTDIRLANNSLTGRIGNLPFKEKTTVVCGTSFANIFDPATGGGICSKYCRKDTMQAAYNCTGGYICSNLYEYRIPDVVNFGYYQNNFDKDKTVLYLKSFFMIPSDITPGTCIRGDNCYFHQKFPPPAPVLPHCCCWTKKQGNQSSVQTQILEYANSLRSINLQLWNQFDLIFKTKGGGRTSTPNKKLSLSDIVSYTRRDSLTRALAIVAILSLGKTLGDMGQIIEIRRQFLNFCEASPSSTGASSSSASASPPAASSSSSASASPPAVPFFLTHDISCGALASLWEVPTLLQKLERTEGEGLIAYKPSRSQDRIIYGNTTGDSWDTIHRERVFMNKASLSDVFQSVVNRLSLNGNTFRALIVPYEIATTSGNHTYNLPIQILASKIDQFSRRPGPGKRPGKGPKAAAAASSSSSAPAAPPAIPYYYMHIVRSGGTWNFYFCRDDRMTTVPDLCFSDKTNWVESDEPTENNIMKMCSNGLANFSVGKPDNIDWVYPAVGLMMNYAIGFVPIKRAAFQTANSPRLETLGLSPMYIWEHDDADPVAAGTRSGGGGSKKRSRNFGSRKRRKSRPKRKALKLSRKRRKSRKAKGKRLFGLRNRRKSRKSRGKRAFGSRNRRKSKKSK